jgi:hypothetical protein
VRIKFNIFKVKILIIFGIVGFLLLREGRYLKIKSKEPLVIFS